MLFEEKLIYFPSAAGAGTPADIGLEYEDVFMVASDGVRIHGFYVPGPSPATVLFCHGNSGNISGRLDRIATMRSRLGVSLFLFDYRGFGRSEGSPDEEGTYRDAVAAHRHLVVERGVAPSWLVLLGESLGAAVAVELALRESSAAIVLEAPFTSIPAMARIVYSFLPFTSRLRTRYDNLAKIARVGVPLIIFHAPGDGTVPFTQGEELFRAARGPKRFVPLEHAGHADGFSAGGEDYWRAWEALLDSLALRRSEG